MFIAIAALLFQFPISSSNQIQIAAKVSQPAEVAQAADDSPSAQSVVLSAANLPANAEAPVALKPGRLVAEPIAVASPAPATPAPNPSPAAIQPAPIVPVYGRPIRAVSDRRQNREWLALSIAAHGAAGFDAWSTRRVMSSVPGAQEMNPLLRPFAGNASMYAAVQVAPTLLDFLSRRMMNSRNDFLRHTWWLPQAVSAVISISSGAHNIGVYNSPR
jgi:hypothetical protein